jgi:hypothetical protein
MCTAEGLGRVHHQPPLKLCSLATNGTQEFPPHHPQEPLELARLLPEGRKNPHFNRNKFQFEFQNGEVLRLKLYEHLKV